MEMVANLGDIPQISDTTIDVNTIQIFSAQSDKFNDRLSLQLKLIKGEDASPVRAQRFITAF